MRTCWVSNKHLPRVCLISLVNLAGAHILINRSARQELIGSVLLCFRCLKHFYYVSTHNEWIRYSSSINRRYTHHIRNCKKWRTCWWHSRWTTKSYIKWKEQAAWPSSGMFSWSVWNYSELLRPLETCATWSELHWSKDFFFSPVLTNSVICFCTLSKLALFSSVY